jgi:hypothetical protein
MGLDKGVWYRIRQGIRGLLAHDEGGKPRVYVVCEPSSQYYQVMTRGSCWMPVLIGERIRPGDTSWHAHELHYRTDSVGGSRGEMFFNKEGSTDVDSFCPRGAGLRMCGELYFLVSASERLKRENDR